MARFRVYIKPFGEDGVYLDDFIEVTKDVATLGNPKLAIESNDFDVGVVKNSSFSVTLRNDHGYYSDVTELRSIFRSTRKNSLVRITWDIRDFDLVAGFFTPGEAGPLGGEYTIFDGLINEVTSVNNIGQQQATFTCLGFDSLLNEMEIPFDSISNGDLFSEILLAMLDQAPFNERVTVSASNIAPATDLEIDDKTTLENKSVGQVLKAILLASNSVLYIKEGVAYVTGRNESADLMFTFYGQASRSIENILNIPKFRDGMNRVFNLWTWDEVPSVDARDTTSIDDYGVRPKVIRTEVIADGSTSKIQTILDANRDEFAFPKVELDLETPLTYDTVALNILDKVNIDYPTIYIAFDGSTLPRYGMEFYDGTARYPYEQWALTLSTVTYFKIISRIIDVKKQTITFGLRET